MLFKEVTLVWLSIYGLYVICEKLRSSISKAGLFENNPAALQYTIVYTGPAIDFAVLIDTNYTMNFPGTYEKTTTVTIPPTGWWSRKCSKIMAGSGAATGILLEIIRMYKKLSALRAGDV